MADDHSEPRAEFPVSMLVGGVVIALVVTAILSIFVFGMGGHGPTASSAQSATPATTPKH